MPDLRIVLADDHSIVRKGLRSVLEAEPGMQVVGEASTGLEAVSVCQREQPHAAIVDIAMPVLNGIDAIPQIRRVSPATAIVILSMHSDETYVLRALGAGARGYLLKDNAEDDVRQALQAVVQGRSFLSPAIQKTLLEDYVRFLRQRGLEDSYELLTDRERQVLQLLAEGRANKEVASLLGLALSTVETHRTNLMQKLNLHSTAEIVLYAVRKKIIS
jgi:two-component system, NarL family, response regulator NreC